MLKIFALSAVTILRQISMFLWIVILQEAAGFPYLQDTFEVQGVHSLSGWLLCCAREMTNLKARW